MRKSINTNPIRALFGLFLIAFISITASCSGSATPIIEQDPSETLPEQVIDNFPSVPKLSPGQKLRFEHISLEQGLSQSTIFCMVQDSQGFMWFGTEDGLNKYDGYTFTAYKHDPDDPNSLNGNWILSMLEDRSGRFWIGTREGGLELYDRESDQFTHYQNTPEIPASLSDNEITSIYQDQEGVIWVGTAKGGLNKLNQDEVTFSHFQYDPGNTNSLSSNAVAVIYGDQEGMLWVGTDDAGLSRYDRETERWSHYRNNPDDPDSLGHNSIKAIFEDSSGVLWVGTDGGGMDKFDPENDRFIHFQHDPEDPKTLSGDIIAAIYQDWDGILWAGTIGSGLNRYDSETETFTRYQQVPGDQHSLSNNYIISILQDREGVLWFGTFGAGVNKLNNGWMNFAHYQNDANNPNSLSDNMVRAFFEDNDNVLWIGSLDSGVDRFDRENDSWRNFPHNPDDFSSLSDSFVSAMYEDRSGVLWIGTGSGLDRFESETGTFTHFKADPDGSPESLSNNVRAIYESTDGQFWIGTKGGLYRFNPDEKGWSHHYYHEPGDPHSLSENWIFTIIEDQDGKIWLGTVGGGLNRFDSEKETFSHYKNDPGDPNSLSNNFVMSIFQDSQGALWIGTPGGLDRFDPGTETFTHYREEDGLPNNTIYCILEETQGYLWVSTNKGLSRFDPQNEEFKNYDISDGLQSNEFNGSACHANDNGVMFFGGIDGFNIFTPDQIQANSTIPLVVLTSLVHNNEQVYLDNMGEDMMEVTLKWPENSFEFEYAALSFTQPEKNQYAYYLEGFEETWNNVGSRRYGQYTNLPGGTYTLRVKGSNNDGVWNEVGIVMKITIVPPFWQARGFIAIVILALAGLIYGGYRLRVRNLEAHGLELEAQVEQRTTELMQTQANLKQSEMEKAITEERNRLARDLHDSVTQSIYSLTLFAEAGQRMIRGGDLKQAEGNQTRLGEIAQQALQEMRLLVYELRPQILQSEGLIGALEHRLEAVERRAGITARMQVELEINLPLNLEEELFHISMEALNNALKHAKASEVVLSLKSEEDTIILTVEDNGRGFDQELVQSQAGMGLTSMAERVEKIGGGLAIKSGSGPGTRISVSVPLHSYNHTSSNNLELPS